MVVSSCYLNLLTQFFLMPMVGKGKSSKKAKAEPSREDMHAVVVDILKEVDFNTVSDISVAIHVLFAYLEFCNITYLQYFVLPLMQATLSDILRQLGMTFHMSKFPPS